MHPVLAAVRSFFAAIALVGLGAAVPVLFVAASDAQIILQMSDVREMQVELATGGATNPLRDASQMVHELSSGNAERGWCSAVAVGPDVAMTAAHCAEGRKSGPVFLHKDGVALPVTSWQMPNDGDFAFITVPGLTGPYAERLNSELLQSFDNVFVLGYPLGGELTDTYGYFIGWAHIDGQGFKEDVLLVTAPVKPGNSGGGVFVVIDSKAYLIGILVASLNDGRAAFAVDVTR